MRFQTINPATNKVIRTYTYQDKTTLLAALETADSTFRTWRNTAFSERKDCLNRLAALTEENLDELAALITQEMGKPITEARSEIKKCASLCRYYAETGEALLQPKSIKTDNAKSYVRFDPLGVVLGIMPWNFPFWQVYRYAVPTLFAGNTTLLKHAPNTTGSGLRTAELFAEAGFPKGAFQTILADTDDIPTLIQDRRIQGVTLTGSERAGASVAAQAGSDLKKTVLELGGSDPFIVLADADLKEAAKVGAQARLMNTGQSCIAAKRFLVEEGVADAFLELLEAEMTKRKPDDPTNENTQLGCLARADLSDKLEEQIRNSVKAGAKLHTGGVRDGNFFTPAILTHVKPGMPAYTEEFFGPVAIFMTFKDEDELLHIANATEYGLGAALWTQDIPRAERLARHIESGSVFVNQLVRSDPKLPFGGVKRSGYGRELSEWGIREFTNIKTVAIA